MRRGKPLLGIVMLIGALLLYIVLFLSPYIGMADNGDYARIMTSGGISVLPDSFSYKDKYFGYAHRTYPYGSFGLDYVSSQAIFILAAGLIGRLWNNAAFDMHVLGILYGILLLVILGLCMKGLGKERRWIQITLAAAVCFVYFDIGYVAYFQSFYGEPVSMLSLLLAIVLAILLSIRERPGIWLLLLYTGSAWLLTTSKLQHAAVGLILGAYCIRLYNKRSERVWKRTVMTGAVIIVLSAGLMYICAPKELKQINLYQTIFYGIMKDSPHPEEDLRVLDIPEKYKVLAGTNYFQKDTAIPQDSPGLVRDVYSRLGHLDVVRYYLIHPSRIADKLHAAAANASFIRPYYLGNYEKAAGEPSGAMSFTYSTWSEGKKELVPRSLLFYLLFYALYLFVIGYEWTRRRLRRSILEVMLLLGILSIITVAVPLVGDGEADLGKHLFLFNVSFDMMVIALLLWLIAQCRRVLDLKV